jgi:hypothetical protein
MDSLLVLVMVCQLRLGQSSSNGVHLSLGRAPGEMVVSWSTETDDPAVSLRYGTDPLALSLTATVRSKILANKEKDPGPKGVLPPTAGNWRNITVHSATLTSLTVGQTYFYNISHARELFNFTYKLPYSRTGPVNFAVFGDLGVQDQSGASDTMLRLREYYFAGEYDMVLHVGDFAYDLREKGGRRGDQFFDEIEPFASSAPYMTCPGNHERDCVADAQPTASCQDAPYTNYKARFNMPTPSNASSTSMYWSADVGFVHLVSLNVDIMSPGATSLSQETIHEQLTWLRNDLQATANLGRTSWTVVIGHQMMYSTHDAAHVENAKVLREGVAGKFSGIEPLFHEFGVDIYFSGHEHVYEHFARAYASKAQPTGTAHIVVGNAGDREFPYAHPWAYPMLPFERKRIADPSGFGILSVPNASTMVWRQYCSRSGKVLDEHVFSKSVGSFPVLNFV